METGGSEEAQPERRLFWHAARAPIGAHATTRTKKYLDSVVIVIAPLIFPALVLGITRTGYDRSVMAGFTLVDIAFGIAAVAFAALAKSVADGHENWKLVGMVAVVVMAFETALAVKVDNMAATDMLTGKVSQCVETCDTMRLNELALNIQQSAPSALHWIVALLTGTFLCVMAFAAIWKES